MYIYIYICTYIYMYKHTYYTDTYRPAVWGGRCTRSRTTCSCGPRRSTLTRGSVSDYFQLTLSTDYCQLDIVNLLSSTR